MANLVVLGNWHGGSSATQYVRAFRRLGHRVTTVGPRFGQADADRWRAGLLRMTWPPTPQEADAYVQAVLDDSEVPDVETQPGAIYRLDPTLRADAVLEFWAYGEQPALTTAGTVATALIAGDTHTGRLREQVQRAAMGFQHVFVQYRCADLAAFTHPSKFWLPAAADPDVWAPPAPEGDAPPDAERDGVLFVGATDPAMHTERVALLEWLQAQGLPLTVKHAYGREAARLMGQARVVLNRSLAGDLNLRVMETLCAGAPLVTDVVEGLAALGIGLHGAGSGGSTAATYHRREACADWLRSHLAHPDARRDMARAGRELVLARHTYRHRAQEVLDLLLGDAHADGTDTSRVPRPHHVSHPVLPAAVVATDRLPTPPVPQVSVIIPAFNHYLDATQPLLHYLSNTLDPREVDVRVIDDGSTDETARIHQTMGAHIIHRGENGGFAAACNTGAHSARGDTLIFLNNDARPEPSWLEPLVAEARDSGGIAGSLLLNLDGSVQAAGLWWDAREGQWRNSTDFRGQIAPYDVPAIMGACFAIRRDTYWRLGGLDEGFRSGGEDVDLCLRARALGLPVRLVPASRVRHAEGTTRFALPDARERVSHNLARLRERWAIPGTAPLPAPTIATAAPPLRVSWQGPSDPRTGGSLAIINVALLEALSRREDVLLVTSAEDADVTVLHEWPGLEPHRVPPGGAPFLVTQPWEQGAPPAAWARTWAHPRFRGLITPSAHSAALFQNAFPERDGRVWIIPNGIDPAVFRPEGERWPHKPGTGDVFRVLFVGGLLERKGVDTLYAAWRRAFRADEPVRLLLKAQGGQTFYAGQEHRPPADLANVRVLDEELPPADLAALYRSVALVCQPYHAEGFCLPLLEAMACGVAVCTSDQGPAREFVPEGAGLWVPPGDPEALAQALRWAYLHRERLPAMGAVGADKAQLYTWDRIAPQYVDAMKEAIGHA